MSSPIVVLNKNDEDSEETNIFPLSVSSPPPPPTSKTPNQENKRQYLTRGQRKQKGCPVTSRKEQKRKDSRLSRKKVQQYA